MTARDGRGRCPVCRRMFTLRRDRRVRRHVRLLGVSSVICPGSGQVPQ